MHSFGGGSDIEFATGCGILLAQGGTENNTCTLGGDGIDAYGGNGNPPTATGYSGSFQNGDVAISNNLGVGGAIFAGTKDFRIDHPLDPSNRYFYHASVESSEMMDIYHRQRHARPERRRHGPTSRLV